MADYEERTYHGTWPTGTGAGARILVESTETGPTERELHLQVLRELHPTDEAELGGFGWGYNGSGTSRAAAAILADALELGDVETSGLGTAGWPEDDVLIALREDFCEDVLAQLLPEWRLRHGAVLRWALGWYTQHNRALPAALQQLPEI